MKITDTMIDTLYRDLYEHARSVEGQDADYIASLSKASRVKSDQDYYEVCVEMAFLDLLRATPENRRDQYRVPDRMRRMLEAGERLDT